MNEHLPPIRRDVAADDVKGNSRTAKDSVAEHQGILPPRNGTILRIIDFPPEPRDERDLKEGETLLLDGTR
jgi:hypothetical protein